MADRREKRKGAQLRRVIVGERLKRAFFFALATSLLIVAIEQVISYGIIGSILGPVDAASYFLVPLFVLSFGSYAAFSLLGLSTSTLRRFAIIMGVSTFYLLWILSKWLAVAPWDQSTYLLGAVVIVAGFWGVACVRNRQMRPVTSVVWAGFHLGVAHAWLTINPERILDTYPIIAFSLQVVAVGFLLAGCFRLSVESGITRISRYAIGLAIGVVACLSIVSEPLGWTTVASPRPENSLKEPPRDFPNLLWIVFDTLRKDHLPVYGYKRNTAVFLSDLANKSTVYSNVISTAGWTLPAHASMFTGLYVREHGAHRSGSTHSRLDEGKITVAEILQGAGYRTGAFSANNGYVQPATGLAQGFDSFSNFVKLPHRLVRMDLIQFWIDLVGRDGSENLRVPYPAAREVTRAALEWIDERGQSPWFLFLNYMEAHRPRRPPRSDRDFFPGRISPAFRLPDRRKTPTGDAFTAEELADLNSQYDAQIRTLDFQLMMLIQTLGQRDLLENTVVVITSDHGDHLGEHDMVSHGAGLYKELLEVPLIVRRPGGKGAGIEPRLMSSVEIAAIALAEIPLDRLELDSEHRAHLERLFRRHQNWESGFVVSELHSNESSSGTLHADGIAIQKDGFKFIASHRSEALYDLNRDSRELVDVRRRHPQKTNEMREQLERFKQTVPEYLGSAALLHSRDDEEALRALGYIE